MTLTLTLIIVFFLVGIAWTLAPYIPFITRVPMEQGSRKIRIGGGQEKHQWYFRIDLWFFGIRIG